MSIIPAADISTAVIDITTGLTGGAFVPITRNIFTISPILGGGDLSADRTLSLLTSPVGQVPVGVTRSIATTAPLHGGGDLSADRTLTVSQFTDLLEGTVSASSGGITKFLRADNTWQVIAGGTGVPATRLINTTLPLTGGGDLTADRTLGVNDFTPAARGTVPASGGGIVNFLRADGAWAIPGTGVFITLQPTTPGSVDTGHGHISGVFIADTSVGAGLSFPTGSIEGITLNGVLVGLRSTAYNNINTPPLIDMKRSRGSETVPLPTLNNDLLGSIRTGGMLTGLAAVQREFIRTVADGNAGAGDQQFLVDYFGGSTATAYSQARMSAAGLRLGPGGFASGDRALSSFDLIGSLGLHTVTKTGNYVLTATDYRVLCDGTGGGFTITLPSAASLSGRQYEIVKVDAASTIIKVLGPVSGAASIPLTGPMDSVVVVSDGTFWWLIEDNRSNLVGQTITDSGAIANTNTKQAFNRAITIPANRAIFPGTAFIVEAGGTYSTTGTPTLSFFMSDSANVADFATSPAITTPNNAASYLWFMRAAFVFRAVGNTVNPKLIWGKVGLADGSSVITERILSPSAGNTSTQADATYVPEVTWSVADPANTITMKAFSVFMYGNGARVS